ncbi:MAG: hypothetical protein M1333_01465 [Patescibacteria group bacterium]|nr:hypothetical protein [Patescibacteria group bacterium]
MQMHLIELYTQEGVMVSASGKEAYPMREYQDAKTRLAIGRLLLKHQLRQEHGETMDRFASRVREALAPPAGCGLVAGCVRGKVLIRSSGDVRRKVEGVIVFVIQNGNGPVYLFGPWVWFSECERLARKRLGCHFLRKA